MWYEVILNYLGQASTYKGLFALLAAFGVIVSPDMTNAIIAVCLAVIGLIDVIINEKKDEI